MCGIVGFLGSKGQSNASPSVCENILEGLRRLEYRGYDSAGVALRVTQEGVPSVRVVRAVGPLAKLEEKLKQSTARDMELLKKASSGVGHTRWATHGKVTESNAHPHKIGQITIVVNGIIENYQDIKQKLSKQGAQFESDTDSELVAHLLHQAFLESRDRVEAALKVVKELRGSFAAVWLVDSEDALYAIKNGAPLVIGKGKDAFLFTSDPQALGGFASEVAFPEDGSFMKWDAQGLTLVDFSGKKLQPRFEALDWSPQTLNRGNYPHYMLKEINEQPDCLLRTLSGKVDFSREDLGAMFTSLTVEQLKSVQRVVLLGCGTAYHAALSGKYMIETAVGCPVECDLSSEFRYRENPLDKNTLCIAVTQSGETADTLAAVRKARSQGALVMTVTNVSGSSVARESQEVFLTRCDVEVGVAATKTFTGQLLALQLVALGLAKMRGQLSRDKEVSAVRTLAHLPTVMREAIHMVSQDLEKLHTWCDMSTFLFIGRGLLYPIALEGALKLKEISYLHAEGYAAGELKHGPIAMVDEKTLCFVLVGQGALAEKTLSNLEEVKARGSVVVTMGETSAHQSRMDVPLPTVDAMLMPYVNAVPVQLIAYRMACLKGLNPDRPRNLAKSVTVE